MGDNFRLQRHPHTVIDDGVENHEDFDGRVLAGFTAGLNNTGGVPLNHCSKGHGMNVAGITAATHNNSLGIKGVAPNSRIIPINIFPNVPHPLNPNGAATSAEIATAINWAWNPSDGNAHILNNSWGGGNPNPDVTAAITDARTLGRGNLGAIVIFASGNSHQQFSGVNYPATVNGVITVGAIDRNGSIWNYSSRGPEMDLVAPSGGLGTQIPPAFCVDLGGDVATTDREGILGYDPGDYTEHFGGTSAAAPQVSGVAALMLSVNPGLTETEVRAILQNTANEMGPIGFDNTYGYGRVNAHAAVQAALPPISGPDGLCASTTNYTLQNVPPGATVSWTASPSGLFTNSSGTGATAALSAIHGSIYGAGTLTFTIETDCGEYQANKAIWVGVPDANDIKIAANYYPICPNEDTYFNAWYEGTEPGNQDADIVYYDWNPPLSNCITAGIKNEVLICNFPSDGLYLMRISAENSCGQGGYRYEYLNIFYCFYYTINLSPNPANGTVNLNLTETPLDEEAKILLQSGRTGSTQYQEYSFSKAEYTVKIYDMHAKERYCKEAGPDSLWESLDISHLPPGLYVVHIEHSRGTIIRQLKVE